MSEPFFLLRCGRAIWLAMGPMGSSRVATPDRALRLTREQAEAKLAELTAPGAAFTFPWTIVSATQESQS